MSGVGATTGYLDSLSRLSGQQWSFRVMAPVATSAMLILEGVAGGSLGPGFTVFALVLSCVAGLLPDSGAPLFLVLLLALHWATAVPEQLNGWVLLAAVILLVLHVSSTLASYGPSSLVLDAELLTLWARRCAVVVAVTALAWLLARVLSGMGLSDSGWALAAALLVVIGWTGFLARHMSMHR